LGADSLFVSSFRITKSGLYSGSIFIGSDFQIETAVSVAVIQTSTPSAQTSSILIANRTWTAGVASDFKIEFRDDFGNQIHEFPGFARVTITKTSTLTPVSCLIDAKFTESVFLVQSIVTQTGAYFVSVDLNGILIRPSPLSINVIPGSTCASTVRLNQIELRNAVAMTTCSFSIRSHDSFGNAQLSGGESSLFNISLSKAGEQLQISPFILDRNDSVYIAFYIPTVAGKYHLSVYFGSGSEKNHIHMSPVVFQIALNQAPTVEFCRFAVGGTSLVVSFSASTDRGQFSNSQPCSSYIDDVSSLGNGCVAFWATDKELHLSLGTGALLAPGNVLTVKKNVIRAYMSSSLYISGQINVVAPFGFPVKAVLSTPAEVSHCNDIILDAASSTGSCGRPFVVSWFVSYSANRAFEIQQILNLHNGKLQARIPADLLLPGEEYLFGVYVSNFFGFSDSTSTSVFVHRLAIPSVFIQGSSEIAVNIFEDNYISATVVLSGCQESATDYNIRWTITKFSPFYVDPPVVDPLSISNLDLLLPSGSLDFGGRYFATVIVSSKFMPSVSSSAACTIVGIGPRFSMNMVKGGSRSVGFQDPIILELIPQLSFTSMLASSWSCSPEPCFSPFSPGIQVVGITMFVASGQLSPGSYTFRITVIHEILQSVLTDEISIHVIRHPADEVSAFIFSKTFGKISSDSIVSLDGSLSSAKSIIPSLEWKQVVGDELLSLSDEDVYTHLEVASAQAPFIVFASAAMTPSQMFVFRLTASSQGYTAFAEIAFLTNEPPSGGTFEVQPKMGTSLETVFALSLLLWYDEDLPLKFNFFVADDKSASEILLASSFQSSVFVLLPPMTTSVVTLIGKVIDCFGSISQLNDSVVINLPTINSIQYASNLVTQNVSMFLGVGDYTRALQILLGAVKLMQMLEDSGSVITKSFAAPKQQSVTSVVLESLNSTVYKTRMKQTLLKQLLQVFEAVASSSQTLLEIRTSLSILDGLTEQIRLRSLDISAQELQMVSNTASNTLSASSSKTISVQSETSLAIHSILSEYLFEFTRRLVPGQIPGSASGSSFQLQANRALPSHFAATVGRNLSGPSVQLKYPDSVFSEAVAFSDVNVVLFTLDPKPTSNRNAMSQVLSLRARGSIDVLSSGIEQYVNPDAIFSEPAEIVFEKHHPVGISFNTESCMYWSENDSAWSTDGCIVHSVNGTYTKCLCFHFSDFGIVMYETLADYDYLPDFGSFNSNIIAPQFRIFAVTMTLVLVFGYALSVSIAKSYDERINKKLLIKIRKNRVEKIKSIALPSAQDSVSDEKALDYIRIKAILRERFIFRYSNWIAEFTRQVKSEHVIAGIFFMPDGSAFTRPRRVSVLFLSFISNFSLTSILLGSSVDNTTIDIFQQALIAGVSSALLSFPIYMIILSLFNSIESDSLWMNQRAARVQKVKEDAALKLASSMLARNFSRAGRVDSAAISDDFIPHPPNQRPTFVRTAANSKPTGLSVLSHLSAKSLSSSHLDVSSLTSAKLPELPAKLQRPRPSKSTLSAVASMTYLSRPSTASPASLRSTALKSNVPTPKDAAPAAAAIRTLGARLALKQATQRIADIPAPSSGVPRPLISPSLRRVLYSASSVKSASTSALAHPPPGMPAHQRARVSARVGAYLPRRALPTISNSVLPTVMIQTESELSEIGTKHLDYYRSQTQSFGKRIFEFLKARSLSMSRKQLPPKFISVIYAVFGMVAGILLYFGLIYGIRFIDIIEQAWALAFFVAVVQELLVHQLVLAAFRAASLMMLSPLRSDKFEEQTAYGDTTRFQLRSKSFKAVTTSRNLNRLQQVVKSQSQSELRNDVVS
jgi:hypothetical protein